MYLKKLKTVSAFHLSEELVSTITCTTTLTQVRFPHSEIVIEKSIKQFISHCIFKEQEAAR